MYTVLNTYNGELYERFKAAGYDLTRRRHEMGVILGHGTPNRPLLGFAKRHAAEYSPVNAAAMGMGHLFARGIGVSAGFDVLPPMHRTAFLLMLISLNKMLKKIPIEGANAHAQTAFLALYIGHRAAQRKCSARRAVKQ